ncbi:hypothetical protein NDA00_18610 [Funiculus sociatus GB2-M2]|uniref:hypothetical protein n=1 Tax=Cyanophyceae TaxID=3028117 RepID=UPI0018EFF655|nr:hypothetical protein [Trichocoleus sp. FACHB-90]
MEFAATQTKPACAGLNFSRMMGVMRSRNVALKERSHSPNPQVNTMTKTEILAALKQMTTEERLEIIEAASRMMREEIEDKARIIAEKKKRLRAAAEAAIPDYLPGGALHDLWSPDSEPYYDSEEELLEALNAEVKTNA